MQGYRIFAYITMILVVALLVLVTTQALFPYIQLGNPRAWIVLLMLAAIYFSVTYGLSRRFARKPMRPPTTPFMTGFLMVVPPLFLNVFVNNDLLQGSMFWVYILTISVGSAVGTWFGVKAGWNHLIGEAGSSVSSIR